MQPIYPEVQNQSMLDWRTSLSPWAKPTLPVDAIRLVIITKDSAPWIGEILDAYARLRVSPKVLLDAYSTDNTEKILRGHHADYEKIWPEFPRVEAAVRIIGDHVDTRWVFRVDDDELPSRTLLQWIARNLAGFDSDVIGVPRRWLRLSQKGSCEYSNHPLLCFHATAMDPQWRLFQPGRVHYTTHIHTPGFAVEDAPVAPNSAYLAHFDWIVRSRVARLTKVENYDLQSPDAGSFFRDLYVWEDSAVDAHGFKLLETREFDRLARRLQQV